VIGVAVFAERRRPEPRPLAVPPPWGGPSPEAPSSKAEDAPGPQPSPPATPGERDRERGEAKGRAAARPGLGTEFGEERTSPVFQVQFERASAQPDVVLTLRYDDRGGLLAQGVDVDGARWARREEARRREAATPFRSEYCEPPPGWGVR
jgi:hypothetical protein